MNLVDKIRVLTRFARFFRQFTRQDMATFTGLSRQTVDKIVNDLRKTDNVYVSSYAEDSSGRLTVQVFTWAVAGTLRDSRCPALSACGSRNGEIDMKVKTSELTGPALNWAVAELSGIRVSVAEQRDYGQQPFVSRKWVQCWSQEEIDYIPFEPSIDWAQGGPIIEREGIATRQHPITKRWYAMMSADLGGDTQPKWAEFTFRNVPKTASTSRRCRFDSESQLVAAMRCFVASELGDEVDVPEELLV